MDIREFIYHQYLAELGYTKPIVCFSDLDHGRLFAKIEEEDKFYLYCLVCDYKLQPGSELSNFIRRRIKEVTKEVTNAELEGIASRLPPRP